MRFPASSSLLALTMGFDRLPLPEETPEGFRFLPEYLIEDITEFLTFVSK